MLYFTVPSQLIYIVLHYLLCAVCLNEKCARAADSLNDTNIRGFDARISDNADKKYRYMVISRKRDA